VKGNGKSTTNGANTPEDGWQVATGKLYTFYHHFFFIFALINIPIFVLYIKGKRRKKRKDQTAGGAASKKAFAEDNSWN